MHNVVQQEVVERQEWAARPTEAYWLALQQVQLTPAAKQGLGTPTIHTYELPTKDFFDPDLKPR
jgi:hypothetical protein